MFNQTFFHVSLACVILILLALLGADRLVDATPAPATGLNYYKLTVTFKDKLSSDDKATIVKTMAVMASKPIAVQERQVTIKPPAFPTATTGEVQIIITGAALTDSEKDSVEKFTSSMVDSYIARHGNGVASVVMNDADPPGSRRQYDDVQRILDSEAYIDISS